LKDSIDVGKLGGAADRAAVSLMNSINLVTPINVRVYVNKSYGSTPIKCAEYRYGDTVITTYDNREGSPIQDGLYSRLCNAIVSLYVSGVSRHVSTVDHSNVVAIEQRSSHIKIPMVQANAKSGRFKAHS
jgi:hypothetical protein